MFFFDFNSKLKRLNPNLYCGGNSATVFDAEWRSIGIYYRRTVQEAKMTSALMAHASDDERAYIKRREEGDEFVSGVTINWVPEHPKFSPKGKLLAKGWRSIVLELVRKGFVSIDRAKKVFNCPSLGESDFDKLSYDGKKTRLQQK